MYCYRCGKPNPQENRFCGMCGARLPEVPQESPQDEAQRKEAGMPPAPPAQRAVPPSPPLPPPAERELREEPRRQASGIGGPSFLGLGGSTLLDEIEEEEAAEARSRSRRRWAAALVVLVLGGLLLFQWTRSGPGLEQLNELRTAITQQLSGAQAQPANPAQEAQPAGQDLEAGDSEALPASDGLDAAEVEGTAERDDAAAPRAPEVDEGMGDFVPPPPPDQEEAEPEAGLRAPPEQSARAQAARRTPAEPAPPASEELVRRADVFLNAAECEQGVILLRQAAQEGSARAHVKLGALHATGRCVPMDRLTAYRWFTLAQRADPGNAHIAHSKQMLLRDMDDYERQRAEDVDHMPIGRE